MLRRKNLHVLLWFWGLLVLALNAWAQSVPQRISYQGMLMDDQGHPVPDGPVDMVFTFHGVETGFANQLLGVQQSGVTVKDGLYNVLIGSGTIIPYAETSLEDVFHNHTDVWMGIEVNGDGEMAPRSRIASAPYALKSPHGAPRGLINIWSGTIANIPAGWQLCDGTNGTPDLRDRFIMGAPSGQDPGQTGGEHQKSLTVANMPSHNHSITIDDGGSHLHTTQDRYYESSFSDYDVGGLIPNSLAYTQTRTGGGGVPTEYGPYHSHSASCSATGSGDSFDNRPAYYTLAFIIRK